MSRKVSAFEFGDRVLIDGDRDLVGIVIGMAWYWAAGHDVQISWMANGDAKAAWFHPARLTMVAE